MASLRGESHVGNVTVSVSERPGEVPLVAKAANEIAGYLSALKPHQAVKKCLGPIDGNARNKVWTPPDLNVYANNEYVYAIYPIAIALFWERGGKEICESKALTVIFTIMTHCLNVTAPNNYAIRAVGKWSCGNTIQKKGLCQSRQWAIF